MTTEIEIYTDGACIGNGKKENIGGWSFVVVDKDGAFLEAVDIEFNTTNNRQEIKGVLNALKCCLDHKIYPFTLFSDSQYVVNGFNSWMHKWHRNRWVRGNPAELIPNADLWKEMWLLKQSFDKIELKWVRGHNGNKWNERADELINLEIEKTIKSLSNLVKA